MSQISTKGAQNQYCQDAQSAKGTDVLLHPGRVDRGALILVASCNGNFQYSCEPLRPGLNFLKIIAAFEDMYCDHCVILNYDFISKCTAYSYMDALCNFSFSVLRPVQFQSSYEGNLKFSLPG